MATAFDLAGLQLDPISVVAPSTCWCCGAASGGSTRPTWRGCAGGSGDCSSTGRTRPRLLMRRYRSLER
jgi:hypothetical protein